MSHGYRPVQWTPFKRAYDLGLGLAVLGFVVAYVATSVLVQGPVGPPAPVQLLARAFGAAAFTLLTLILATGPLARLSPRFLPLLYNRRHAGVACFLLALVHAALLFAWYHGYGEINPFVSLLASNPRYDSLRGFPFESLGVAALLILFVMAATSHDFFNANLGPALWKSIHMAIYAAYALLVGHVMLGAVQGSRSPLYGTWVGAAALAVVVLHLVAGRREVRQDRPAAQRPDGWLRVGPALAIDDGCARVVTPPQGERIAVFRQADRVFAVSNVCRHQGGPLGEGRIVDGCITCPWHGFQYRPEDGCAPPPFHEKILTYRTRVEHGEVFVDPRPCGLGVPTPPSVIPGGGGA